MLHVASAMPEKICFNSNFSDINKCLTDVYPQLDMNLCPAFKSNHSYRKVNKIKIVMKQFDGKTYRLTGIGQK